MAFHSMFEFTGARSLQDNSVDLWGQPVTIFRPRAPMKMQGYENEYEYEQSSSKAVIDFKPKRRVFYHYNWFPEDEDQIVQVYFKIAVPVECDMFIRTVTIDDSGFEQVSPYGDLIFRIVKIGDEGKYRVLRRICFATAITDSTLYDKLKVKAAT